LNSLNYLPVEAGSDLRDPTDILRILTLGRNVAHSRLAAGFTRAGNVLFASYSANEDAPTASVRREAERHRLDVVLASHDLSPRCTIPVVFDLGIQTRRGLVWHSPLRPWLDGMDGAGCFIPIDPVTELHICVEGDRLVCVAGHPWTSSEGRGAGLLRADAAYRRLLGDA
jgi:hypothetical protein